MPGPVSLNYSPLVLSPVGNLGHVVGLVCLCSHVSVRPAGQTHISVATCKTFLILGMMMGYDLGMMAIV